MKKLFVIIACFVCFVSCNKIGNSTDIIRTYTGTIYSSVDSMPIKNTVFEIYTTGAGYNQSAFIDYSLPISTDSNGYFSVTFNIHNHSIVGLKWPSDLLIHPIIRWDNQAVSNFDNPNAGKIYTQPK